jgi:hypothetical protein
LLRSCVARLAPSPAIAYASKRMHLSSARLLATTVALAELALSGCSADVVAAGADANASSTHALLVVEQSAPLQSTEPARAHASMWFLRVSDEPSVEAVTRLVTDLAEVPAVGTCVAPASRRAERITTSLAPVELAFAGDVFIDTAGSSVQLAVRAFPDVANLVSGVMYTAPGQSDLGALESGELAVRASGTEGVPTFSAIADAPEAPQELRIDGLPIDSQELQARRDRPLSISWSAGEPGDGVYVDIDPVPGSLSDRVRCAMADTGQGQIATMAIPETSALRLSVHRVRVTALHGASGDIGTAHFDVAVSARVKVAAP